MKLTRAVALAAVVLAVSVAFASAGADRLAIGAKAPMADVRMLNVDGHEFSINDVVGEKGTLVVFTCNTCPASVDYEERLAAYSKALKDKEVGVIWINPNDPARNGESYEDMQKRAEERGFVFPYVVDAGSDVARAFGASRTPEVFLFDAEGSLAYTGGIDDSRNLEQVEQHFLKDAATAMLAGDDIAVRESRAIG